VIVFDSSTTSTTGSSVDEVQLVGQSLVLAHAAKVAERERPVVRRRAEHAPHAHGQRPAVAEVLTLTPGAVNLRSTVDSGER